MAHKQSRRIQVRHVWTMVRSHEKAHAAGPFTQPKQPTIRRNSAQIGRCYYSQYCNFKLIGCGIARRHQKFRPCVCIIINSHLMSPTSVQVPTRKNVQQRPLSTDLTNSSSSESKIHPRRLDQRSLASFPVRSPLNTAAAAPQ